MAAILFKSICRNILNGILGEKVFKEAKKAMNVAVFGIEVLSQVIAICRIIRVLNRHIFDVKRVKKPIDTKALKANSQIDTMKIGLAIIRI